MATALTYPGVYVEEVSSGVRTITGVATSIAAFVGYTRRGEPDKAVAVYSFGDFERSHGGLDRDSPLSYAVRQFFTNGGTQALIVRVAAGAKAAHWVLSDSSKTAVLDVFAKSPGTWADDHVLTVTHDARNPDADFNLVVCRPVDGKLTVLETHRNLNMNPASPQFAPAVVNAASRLVKLSQIGAAYTNAGAAVSKAFTFPLGAPGDRVIEGVVDGNAAFRLELPAGAPLPSTPDALVDALKKQVPPALSTRLAISASTSKDAGVDKTTLKIASTATGATSRVTIAPGALGGLAKTIGIGLANGGQEFTGDAQHRPAKVDAQAPTGYGADGTKGDALELIGDVTGTTKTGMKALLDVDLFNILSIPETFELAESKGTAVIQAGIALCEARDAFYVVDPPAGRVLGGIVEWKEGALLRSHNAAVYFPGVQIADPLDSLRPRATAPSGTIAGVYARTDSNRGVWKAPAGTDATLAGVAGLVSTMNDIENGSINIKGVNALRMFPAYGAVAWGARTLAGADALSDEYKYVPVRRLALFLKESLYRGTQWVVFEPNDEPLWAQIRLNIGAFLHNLFRQGAFQGSTPKDAYFVKCDRETTTQTDINLGIVNIVVGFAPLRPAEFVILKLQQIAGAIQT